MEARALFGWAALFAATVSCRGPETSLVQDLEAEASSPEGRYASFLDEASDRGLVRLSDDSRPSLTPPFPASLRFTITLPDAAFLSFAPALVARQEVRRAGVEYVVRVDGDVVYEEYFDFEDANAALVVSLLAAACRASGPPLVPESFETSLPIVAIESRSLIGDEPKTSARMRVFQGGAVALDSLIGIELRGRSSQVYFPKRQFGLEFRTEGNIQTEGPFLGMPAESDWVLLGPYSDKSLLRDALTFELARRMGRAAPRAVFVELFLRQGAPKPPEEEYQGVYLVTERISRGAGRIDLPRSRRRPGEESGFIAKLDRLDPDTREVHFTTPGGERVILVYPSAKDVTEEQVSYLKDYIEGFEAALATGAYPDFIDIESWVDEMILQELAKNVDAYRSSTYLHKFPGGKLHLGPVWDSNQAYGNATYDEDASFIEGWRASRARPGAWFRRLFQDEWFLSRFRNRYRDLREGPLAPLSEEAMLAFLDTESARLRDAAARNFERWPILGEVVLGNPDPAPDSYEGEVALLKDWLQARARWMDDELALRSPAEERR